MLVASAQIAADLFAPIFAGRSIEIVAVAHLAADRALLAIMEHPGTEAAVALPLREILSEALRLDAAGMIVAHNHPSGDAEPSRADLDATRRLAESASSVGIRLHDHLIFGDNGYRSLRAMGLL